MKQKPLFYLYRFFLKPIGIKQNRPLKILNIMAVILMLFTFSFSYSFVQQAHADGGTEETGEGTDGEEPAIGLRQEFQSKEVKDLKELLEKRFKKSETTKSLEIISMTAIKNENWTKPSSSAGPLCQILHQLDKLEVLIEITTKKSIPYIIGEDSACKNACKAIAKKQQADCEEEASDCETSCSESDDDDEGNNCSGACEATKAQCEGAVKSEKATCLRNCGYLKGMRESAEKQKSKMLIKKDELEKVIEQLQEGSGSSAEECKATSCPIEDFDSKKHCPTIPPEKIQEACAGKNQQTCLADLQQKCCDNNGDTGGDGDGDNGGNGGDGDDPPDSSGNNDLGTDPNANADDSTAPRPDLTGPRPPYNPNGGNSRGTSGFTGLGKKSHQGPIYNNDHSSPKEKIASVMEAFNQRPANSLSHQGQGLGPPKNTGFRTDSSTIDSSDADQTEDSSKIGDKAGGAFSQLSGQTLSSAGGGEASGANSKRVLSSKAKGMFSWGSKKSGSKTPFVATKSVAIGKDHVGVREDNIFIMVHRMNRRLDEEESYFIKDF